MRYEDAEHYKKALKLSMPKKKRLQNADIYEQGAFKIIILSMRIQAPPSLLPSYVTGKNITCRY